MSYVDFVGGAGTESNLSFMEGFVELLAPVDVMTSRTQNYAVRIELGENCGEYVTLLDHHNGPNGAPASPAVTLPAGIHRIRITAFDYDGANGNFNFETNGAGGGFVAGIDGITLSTLTPTDRCFVGRVCEGSEDVLDIEQNVIIDSAALLCSSESLPTPPQSTLNVQASSGYVEIGDYVIQSGRGTTNAAGIVSIAMPVNMQGSYGLTLTAANTSNVTMTYDSDNATSFDAIARDPAGNPVLT